MHRSHVKVEESKFALVEEQEERKLSCIVIELLCSGA